MTNDLNAIRAQMEALEGFTPGDWDIHSYTHFIEVFSRTEECAIAQIHLMPGERSCPDADLIAAAPDMRATILALCEDVERLNAAIVRQAGAAKTLRESTLAEVQYLKDKDRSEYHAAASLDSERLANEILTDESDKLRAENSRLRDALSDSLRYYPRSVVECRGDRCRELWCASCYGWDEAKKYVNTVKAHFKAAHAALGQEGDA